MKNRAAERCSGTLACHNAGHASSWAELSLASPTGKRTRRGNVAWARGCIIGPMRYNAFAYSLGKFLNAFPIDLSPENWRFFNL